MTNLSDYFQEIEHEEKVLPGREKIISGSLFGEGGEGGDFVKLTIGSLVFFFFLLNTSLRLRPISRCFGIKVMSVTK